MNHNDNILLLLNEKYGWETSELDKNTLELVEDVANASIEIYKSQMMAKAMFPKSETEEEKVQYSLFRMMHFLEATSHDKKFLLEYDKWGKGSELHEAMRNAFPKIGYFISLIRKRLAKSPRLDSKILETNDEMSYWLLECHEHIAYQVGLDKEKP
jgi:hypothetical protein